MANTSPLDPTVSSEKSAELARCLPNAELVIYPDSGRRGIFQHHRLFVPKVLAFLEG